MVSPILPNPKPLDKPNAVGGATSLLYLSSCFDKSSAYTVAAAL